VKLITDRPEKSIADRWKEGKETKRAKRRGERIEV